MSELQAPLTTSELLGAAAKALQEVGYHRAEKFDAKPWPTPGVQLFEDPLSIAAVCVFETWHDLADRWLDAQAALADLISEHLSRADPKAWEGYLALLTPSPLSDDGRREADLIRRDTTFVRKLVGTGDELHRGGDVIDVLRPLLPLDVEAIALDQREALDLLPELLEARGVSRAAVAAVVDAFRRQEPLVEAIAAIPRPEES